jgi:NAD(P)-dependent dehydrogenase (short-subunit alcohol dehydrogenase family)
MAYGQSKLANILFGYELAERLKNTGVTVNSLHPGLIQSDLRRHVDDYFKSHFILKYIFIMSKVLDYAEMTTEDGALTQLYVATSPQLKGKTGLYFGPIGVIRKSSRLSYNKDLQSALWNISDSFTALYQPLPLRF